MYTLVKTRLANDDKLFFSDMVHRNNKKQVSTLQGQSRIVRPSMIPNQNRRMKYSDILILIPNGPFVKVNKTFHTLM